MDIHTDIHTDMHTDLQEELPRLLPFFVIQYSFVALVIQYDSLKRNRHGWLFPEAITLSGVCADMNLGGYHHKLPPE